MTRVMRLLAPAGLVSTALLALVIALAVGGGAAPLLTNDPGAGVRYGLPAMQLLVNLAAAGTIGGLVLVVFATAAGKERDRILDLSAASAALWAVAAGGVAFLTAVTVGVNPADPQFGAQFTLFLTDVPLGRAWLGTALLAAAVTVLCFAVRNTTALYAITALAAASLIPMAQQGHSANSASDHDAAVGALGLHILFAAIWLGGLIALVVVRSVVNRRRLATLVARYSTLALISFVVVGVSGLVSAQIRLGGLEALSTPYGVLVIAKSAALVALGVLGAFHRRGVVRRLGDGGAREGAFWRLIVVEFVLMGIASGVAAALGRTPDPVTAALPTGLVLSPAEILTERPLPPPFTPAALLTEWRIDTIWLLLAAFGTFFYWAAYLRLRRRGDAWPLHRPILWTAGMVSLLLITNGGLALYEGVLFSVHMLGHMALTMIVPLLLVPAAPFTLALRAIAKRTDGSRGGRELVLQIVHSRFGAFVSHPLVAAVLFAGSLIAFYYTPLFRWATTDHIGHQWMLVHFLITGFLFVQSMIGIDPVPTRFPYPIRLVVLLATMAFHAFFGLALINGTSLLLADYFGAMGWGTDALVDQQRGGAIAWSVGEVPTVLLAIAVAVSWASSDKKEAARVDRRADNDGDRDLADYNAMLTRLGGR